MHFLTDFLTTIKQLSSLETITEYSVVLSSSTKIWGGWWRWARVSLDGVAPSRMVCVSASVILPLHHKVQKFSSGTGTASQLLCGICTYRLSGLMKVDEHSTYTSVISMTPLPSCLLH